MRRIAIVTGASAGIGKEFVYALDREGGYDEIWAVARRAGRLEALQASCKTRIRPLPADLSETEGLQTVKALLDAEAPDVRLLVNAAGCGFFGPFDQADAGELDQSIRLNILALTDLCRLCLPRMRKGSSIINLGSNSAWQPVPYQAVYGGSKSYVLNFSRAIGRELKPKGIHVMCVCPGWIRTEFQQVARHEQYIRYVDRWYEADEVVRRALKDLKKKKTVSILGRPVRMQVRLVKFLPVRLVMAIWCRQQGIR